jgi:hypothetical protein
LTFEAMRFLISNGVALIYMWSCGTLLYMQLRMPRPASAQ